MAFESTYSANGSTVIGGPQSYYELPPAGGTNTRDNVKAPPTAVVIDFSNQLPYIDAAVTPSITPTTFSSSARPTRPEGRPMAISAIWVKAAWAAPTPRRGSHVLSSNYTVTLYNYTYNPVDPDSLHRPWSSPADIRQSTRVAAQFGIHPPR